MTSKTFVLDEVDAAHLQQLRGTLTVLRKEQGKGSAQLSRELGRSDGFISTVERGKSRAPKLSTLQLWGDALGVRVEFEVQGLQFAPHMDPQFLAAFRDSRPWGAHAQARRFVVVALRQWRIQQGLDVEHLVPLMGVADGDTIRDWENLAQDPLVSRVMMQARMLGTRLSFALFTAEQWASR
jgi:hypothetical protein